MRERKSLSLTLYAYEQYGDQPLIWDLVYEVSNGMSGYLATLTDQGYNVTMKGIFGDWNVANFLDSPGIPDGQFGYAVDSVVTQLIFADGFESGNTSTWSNTAPWHGGRVDSSRWPRGLGKE